MEVVSPEILEQALRRLRKRALWKPRSPIENDLVKTAILAIAFKIHKEQEGNNENSR